MSQRPSKTPRWQQWTEREARCQASLTSGSPALSMTLRARRGPMAHTAIDGLRLG